MLAKFLLLLLQLFIGIKSQDVQYLQNVDCGSYVDYIATDPQYHRYTPYYVKLHRCHGISRSSNPKNKQCEPVPSGIQPVKIYVFEDTAQYQVKEVYNHTDCQETCILKKSNCTAYENYLPDICRCSCNYTSEPPSKPCKHPFYWDQTSCDCRCSLAQQNITCNTKRKEFNEDVCACTCKQKFQIRCANRKQILDPNTCQCLDPTVITGQSRGDCEGDINGGILAVVMIIEALAFIIAYFFLYSYCYKRRYLPKKEAKKEQNNTALYQNGNVPTTRPNEFNTMTVHAEEEDAYNAKLPSDKQLINNEEQSREKDGLLNRPAYYPPNEKSPFQKKDVDWFTYNDVTEVNQSQDSSIVSERDRRAPPDYSDYVSSELSEDGYGSVTVV